MTDESEGTDYSQESSSTQLSGSGDTMHGEEFRRYATIETTSSGYDDSEHSVSKDEDTYTFLPPPAYRVSLESAFYE